MRLNLSLDEEHAAVLTELAERSHLQAGTLARSLLLTALDNISDRDAEGPRDVVALLDSIPGALEDHHTGLAEIASGARLTPLTEL